MAKQNINIGTAANSGNGDPLRTAFTKVNENFTELYDRPVFSGSYNDLTNKPVLFDGNYNSLSNKPSIPDAQINSDWNSNSGISEILNKPSIPTDISELTDTQGLLNQSEPNAPKEWINPNTNLTWSIVDRTGGIRVLTAEPSSEDINSTITLLASSSSFYIPRDETTQRIQDYWDGNVEDGYDYTRIVIDGVEYQGFVTTYNDDGWRIQMDEPAPFDVGVDVTIRYYGNPSPVKWFDAGDYDNQENFLSAKVTYYAFVEGRGQQTGTIWFTSTHNRYGGFDAEYITESSGGDIDLDMYRRPRSQDPFKSLWLTTNSSTSEPVSIMWEAKMFYGSDAMVTPDIIED
jgi:hypothetical protein